MNECSRASDREIDFIQERVFADQGPLTDMDMEEDAQKASSSANPLETFHERRHVVEDIKQLLQGWSFLCRVPRLELSMSRCQVTARAGALDVT
jgi:hypothetical protein